MRDWNEQLKQIEAQLQQQDAELEQAFSTLQSLGDDVELSVPQAALEEIEETCSANNSGASAVQIGIRA